MKCIQVNDAGVTKSMVDIDTSNRVRNYSVQQSDTQSIFNKAKENMRKIQQRFQQSQEPHIQISSEFGQGTVYQFQIFCNIHQADPILK